MSESAESSVIERCESLIRAICDEAPTWAVVLGSGMAGLVDALDERVSVPYADLPGFPAMTIGGHPGTLWIGLVGAARVVVLQGRAHAYEHGDSAAMAVPIRVLARLGCERLLLTNAAGSLHHDMPPGSLMLIDDHLALGMRSPLIGLSGDARFVDMGAAYDPALRERWLAAATAAGITMHRGVYAYVTGPQFETPAEIRALGLLGADAVGMSTAPECVIARHAGMRVLGVSNITNLAAGMDTASLSHEHTQRHAMAGASSMISVLKSLLAQP